MCFLDTLALMVDNDYIREEVDCNLVDGIVNNKTHQVMVDNTVDDKRVVV